MNIETESRETQEKWLYQRGWRQHGTTWRHPDTNIPYMLSMALKMAQLDARLPADFELKVESPSRTDAVVTSFGTTYR
jgi:hypothetical protein